MLYPQEYRYNGYVRGNRGHTRTEWYTQCMGRPLKEIDTVLNAGNEVVLVELTGNNEDGVWETQYRWYEVTDAKNMEVFK